MIIVNHDGPVPKLRTYIGLLKSLAADLDAIGQGRHPDPDLLSDAPAISGWIRTTRPEPCLSGIIDGHPGIDDGRMGLTSGLWVFAPGLGYARTLSRFYRLGSPNLG